MTIYLKSKITYMMALAVMAILLLPATAMADCTDPAGKEGEVTFNDDYLVFQGCDGTDWVAFHDPHCPAGDGCGTCAPSQNPTPGTICDDGSIYAGELSGNMIFAARCDHGQSWDGSACTGVRPRRLWKTSQTSTAGTGSDTDGLANTDAMETAGLALHPAAEACRNLGADWYLPAKDELNMLYENLVDQDGDDTPGGPLGSTFNFNTTGSHPASYYWSSSENTFSSAWQQIFDVGSQNGAYNKNNDIHVRCVRRN